MKYLSKTISIQILNSNRNNSLVIEEEDLFTKKTLITPKTMNVEENRIIVFLILLNRLGYFFENQLIRSRIIKKDKNQIRDCQ